MNRVNIECNEDIAALKNIEGVKDLRPSYYLDCFAKNPDGRDIIVKAMSLSLSDTQDLPMLIEGRMPQNASSASNSPAGCRWCCVAVWRCLGLMFRKKCRL